MVRSSNEISREAWEAPGRGQRIVNESSAGHCLTNGPGPSVRYRTPTGSELGDTG